MPSRSRRADRRGDRHPLNRFWDTAQDVAMTCLTLAKRIGYKSPDEAYTWACSQLRHPADGQALPNYIRRCWRRLYNASHERRVVDTENRLLNTNHAVVGYFTARPGTCPAPVRGHRQPPNALSLFEDDTGRDAR